MQILVRKRHGKRPKGLEDVARNGISELLPDI
jgi:hypothetical protein